MILDCGSRGRENYSRYCNPRLDALAAHATEISISDPAEADRAWRRIFRTLTDDAVVVPTNNLTQTVAVSSRVGNFQSAATFGPLYEQMWVR